LNIFQLVNLVALQGNVVAIREREVLIALDEGQAL